MKRLLPLYYRLPWPARSLAATLRGLYLRSWRYGPETEQLVEEAIERESWASERWKRWQRERLAYILERAATRVPYYRRIWQNRSRAAWQDLENWPVLEKESLRKASLEFLAEDCDPRRMYPEHSSGSTGKPVDIWWSRQTVRRWYALFEARCRRWYGLSRRDRWAVVGGQLITPVEQRKPPFWVWNAAMNQLYMSSYHLAPDLIPNYLDALVRYRIRYVFGYTSSLYALAQEALRLGRRDIRLEVSMTGAEPLYDYQREAIESAFGPVQETYGMAEIVAAASECRDGGLHLWPEVGWVEVDSNGDLLCTSLLNEDNPLIRYRVGDQGSLAPEDARCSCGRKLPLLVSIEGRSDDVLYTPDGRRVGRLSPVFKGGLPVREAQVIQENFDRVRVLYVPDPGFNAAAAGDIVSRLQARLGRVEVVLQAVDEIPRQSNGKFRAVICNIGN